MTGSPLDRRAFLKSGGLLALGLAATPARAQSRGGAEPERAGPLFYVGTYTEDMGHGEGIYLYRLDPASGALTALGVTHGVRNPSFLALGPGGRHLYAVNEYAKGTGAVSAFAVDPATAALTLLNQRSSEGAAPCHVVVDQRGNFVLVANYVSGTASVLPVRPDGSLGPAVEVVQHRGTGPNKERQEGPHVHCVALSPDQRFAIVCDLGIDRLKIYRFDSDRGSLAAAGEVEVHGGEGPRHFVFHPTGRFGYLITEMGSTLTAYEYDPARGALQEIQKISSLPSGFSGHNDAAEIEVSVDGRFLYASNRGSNDVAVVALDPTTGRMSAIQHQPTGGDWPRHFAIDPSGRFLLVANERSGDIVVFPRDPLSGRLAASVAKARVPNPVCIRFL
ncbi:MAG TPA: lactonase family protein [Longimicrobiaceae bacterium]|nr:lactonase family protein [Longimicrobiaceae bacterium]